MPFFAITSQKFRVKDVFQLVHFAPKLFAQILYSSNIALTSLCKGLSEKYFDHFLFGRPPDENIYQSM